MATSVEIAATVSGCTPRLGDVPGGSAVRQINGQRPKWSPPALLRSSIRQPRADAADPVAPAMAGIGRARRASVKDLVTVKLRPQAKASKPCCTGQT